MRDRSCVADSAGAETGSAATTAGRAQSMATPPATVAHRRTFWRLRERIDKCAVPLPSLHTLRPHAAVGDRPYVQLAVHVGRGSFFDI